MSSLSRVLCRFFVYSWESSSVDIDAYAFDSGVEIEVSNDLTITDEWFEQCVATGRLFLRRQCDMVATVVGSVHLLFAGKLPALRGWPPLDFDDIRDPETGDVAPEAASMASRISLTCSASKIPRRSRSDRPPISRSTASLNDSSPRLFALMRS